MIIARDRTFSHSAIGRWKIVALLAIVVLAAFFRLYRIESLPPGDRYDPAFYGVDALRVLAGERPIFFYDYAGEHSVEPLFSYWVALCFLVVGPSTLGIHLAAALVGIATIPAVYLVAKVLFSGLGDEDHTLKNWGPLVAALVMTVSYWHVNWSRYGVRAILVPLFAALVSASLWRGLYADPATVPEGRRSRWSFAACGALLGASLYTYQAARVLPVLVLAGFAVAALSRRTVSRGDWRNLMIVVVASLLVFAPLGIYFVRHPDHFSSRIERVLVLDESRSFVDNARVFLMQVEQAILAFFVGVDQAPYRTLPGRAALNPFLSALLLMGIGFSLSRPKRPVHLFLLAWLAILVLPATLAGEGATAKRAIGALPSVAMLIAVGALAPWDMVRRRGNGSVVRTVGVVWSIVLLGGFVYSGVTTYQDYFVNWASLPGLPTHFEVERAAIGEYAGGLPQSERIYLSPEVPSHPVIRFHSGLREDIRGYNGRVCLVVPERTTVDTTYIISPEQDGHSLELLKGYLPAGKVVDSRGYNKDDPSFVAYRIPAGGQASLPSMEQTSANWEGRMRLLGYRLDNYTYSTGDTIELTLFYRTVQDMDQRYTAFVHLLGPENPTSGRTLWAQNDSEPCHSFYPTSSWKEGEIVVDRIDLSIPDEAPSSTYRIAMGFYEAWSGRRLSATGDSAAEDDIVLLGEIVVKGHDL